MEIELEPTFTFYVMKHTENDTEPDESRMQTIGLEFLTNLSEQLEDKLSVYNVVVKLEPLSISMADLSNGQFVIKAKIKFTAEALDYSGISDHLKTELKRMTILFGSTADSYETGSDHYISGVRVNFVHNGGRRKRTRKRRTRKYKCQTHINIPGLN
jgi:hypothetical protein